MIFILDGFYRSG
uniref:Uncharacterized protein n=1 Tax=Lepeophtheirus salmonis TaxID=72036 RepID=A0A0K2V795_LEPSM